MSIAPPPPHATGRLHDEIAWHASHAYPVLIAGEVGSGKLTAARAIHAASAPAGSLAVLDAAIVPVLGERALMIGLDTALADDDLTVVLRHVECLTSRARRTLGAVVSRHRSIGGRLLLTSTTGYLDEAEIGDAPPLEAQISNLMRLDVAPLRERADELPTLVRDLMAAHGSSGTMRPAAVDALARHDWPGNVRELESLIVSLLRGRRTCDIGVRDLPAELTGALRLTKMKRIERAAIASALADADGNRKRAAETLEIGRSTLYRKIRAYGLAATSPRTLTGDP